MSIFACSQCRCVENTGTTYYWPRFLKSIHPDGPPPPLCSECDPRTKKWHGRFPKMTVAERGLVEGPDGFLYHPDELKRQFPKYVPK